jgi:DNA-binding transcriptional MerR regulator
MSKPQHRRLAVFDEQLMVSPREGSPRGGGFGVSPEQEAQVGQLLQVGELAKLSGKTVRAIHLYEELGLLRPVDRSKGRFRLFNRESLHRVRWITKLQTLGLSLTEIQKLARELEHSDSARGAADKLREVYLEKLAEVQAKLREIHRLERELIASLTYLETCQSACETALPLHSCPQCERHPDQPTPPELVVGMHAQ